MTIHAKNKIPFIASILALCINATGHAANNSDQELDQADADSRSGNYNRAVPVYMNMAARGNPHAQYKLGLLYELGNGVHKDLAKAAALFQKSAIQGYADAQAYLGIIYYSGTGVEKDMHKSEYWFKKGAEQGDEDARIQYAGFQALKLAKKQITLKDAQQAISWMKELSDKGNARAKKTLGFIYQAAENDNQAASGLADKIIAKLNKDDGNSDRSFTIGNMVVIYTPDALSGHGGDCILNIAPADITPAGQRNPMAEVIYVVKSTTRNVSMINIPDVTGSAPRLKADGSSKIMVFDTYAPGPPKVWGAVQGTSNFNSTLSAMKQSSSIRVDFGSYSLGRDVMDFDLKYFKDGLVAIDTLCAGV